MRGYRFASIFLSIFIILPIAFASTGIELGYGVKSVILSPGQEECLTYKLYNSGKDFESVEIGASGQLQTLVTDFDRVEVPPKTTKDKPVRASICLKVPAMSSSKCSKTQYSGEIVAKEYIEGMPKIFNADTSNYAIDTLPLDINLFCDGVISGAPVATGGASRSSIKGFFYLVFSIVSILSILFIFAAHSRNPQVKRKKYMKMYHDILDLQHDLTYDPYDQSKQLEYSALWSRMQKLRREMNDDKKI